MTVTAESSKLTAELNADSNDVQVRVRERGSTEDFIALNFGYGEKNESPQNESGNEIENEIETNEDGNGKTSLVWIAAIIMVVVAVIIAFIARRSQES